MSFFSSPYFTFSVIFSIVISLKSSQPITVTVIGWLDFSKIKMLNYYCHGKKPKGNLKKPKGIWKKPKVTFPHLSRGRPKPENIQPRKRLENIRVDIKWCFFFCINESNFSTDMYRYKQVRLKFMITSAQRWEHDFLYCLNPFQSLLFRCCPQQESFLTGRLGWLLT